MDKIFIRKLSVETIVGVLADERIKKQMIDLSLTLYLDTTDTAKTDHINSAVNYLDISEQIRDFVQASRFFLIETLAVEVLRLLFTHFQVEKATISVGKPQAISFTESVGVDITRIKEDFKYNDVYLLLGSNYNKEENILNAIEQCKKISSVKQISSIYESHDKHNHSKPKYLNVVLHISTELSLAQVKENIANTLEHFCERSETLNKDGKISLDCDILLFNRMVYKGDNIQVPHPDLLEADYALTPLMELLPHFMLPGAEKTLTEINENISSCVTKKISLNNFKINSKEKTFSSAN